MSPVKRIRRNLSSSSHDDNLKKLKKNKTRRNHSPSTSRNPVSNQQDSVRHVSNMFMSCSGNLWGSKRRRTRRIAFEDEDYNDDSNRMDSLTRGNSNMVGGKVDECLKGNNSLDCNAVSKDCILPSEDANVRAEYTSTTHDETSRIPERVQTNSYREETSQKCVGNDKGENWTPKRKSIVTDKCSDVTATLVYKRIRRTSNVDQPTSKSTDEKSRAKIMEGIDTVVSSRQCDEEAECQLIENMVVNECTTSDHLEVVHKTTTENTSSPVTSVSRPVNRIDPKEKMQPLPSSRNKDVSSEDAISSQIWLASTVYQNQASRNVPPLCNDPFRDQLETIRKLEEQNEQTRQQMELKAKSNFEKEMKKIQAKFQEERKKTDYLKMMLAAAAAKSNPEFPGASRMLHPQDAGFNRMLRQLPRQQNATCHSLGSNPSSRGRAAASSQNSYASALQTSYNTSEIFRDLSARLPISSASRYLQAGGEASTFIPASGVGGILLHGMPSHPSTPSSRINSISSVSRNLPAGVEICTPAPHLYLPSSCISGVPHGMPSRPAAPSNSPTGYLSQWLAKPMLPPTTISKVGTHRWHGQENIGLSPHTLSFKDMHMNPNRR